MLTTLLINYTETRGKLNHELAQAAFTVPTALTVAGRGDVSVMALAAAADTAKANPACQVL